MNPEPPHLASGTEPWLQRVDAHGVRCDDACVSFDEMAQGNCRPSDANRALQALDATAKIGSTRSSLIGDATGVQVGEFDLLVAPVQIVDLEACVEWESIATPVADREEDLERQWPSSDHRAAPPLKVADFPLPDVPFIVEDLLSEAKRLSDFGAPTESVAPILDHVAALRKGRA